MLVENNSIDDLTSEERYDVIGAIGGRELLFVVYVERITLDDDIIRIISARKAEKEEQIRYVNGY